MLHLFSPFFVQFSLLDRPAWTVSSKLLTSYNLVGFGQEEPLARHRWMGGRGHSNYSSYFLLVVVLQVVAFCYRHGSCQDTPLPQL